MVPLWNPFGILMTPPVNNAFINLFYSQSIQNNKTNNLLKICVIIINLSTFWGIGGHSWRKMPFNKFVLSIS